MTLVRVLRTEQRTLTRRIYSDETLVDAAGPVTVQVARLDGTVLASGTATDEAGTGVYSFVLTGGPAAPASVTWQLDTLVVTWTGTIGGAAVTLPPDYVEVVGGYLFGLTEARAKPPTLSTSEYSTELLAALRVDVEQDCERLSRWAWVPRFARHTLSGSDTDRLVLPEPDIAVRAIRAVTVAGTAWTADEIDVVQFSDLGVLRRPGGAVWPAGSGNIVVEYEHGHDAPPERVAEAAILHLRALAKETTSGTPSNAAAFNVAADGGAVPLRMFTPGQYRTGIPAVDAVYQRYGRRQRAVVA